MNAEIAKETIDKTFMSVFGSKNPYSLEEVQERFAFDIKLPAKVQDSTTGEDTWTDSLGKMRFITNANVEKKDDWMLPKRQITSIEDIIATWKEVNLLTTERNYFTTDAVECDTVYKTERAFRSVNCGTSKDIVFCDGVHDSEFMIASQRSANCSFCIKVDDSVDCNNCYSVIGSGQCNSSMIIQDCANLFECIFCAHISDMRYCIANMQFEKEEYFTLKTEIIKWIFKFT